MYFASREACIFEETKKANYCLPSAFYFTVKKPLRSGISCERTALEA